MPRQRSGAAADPGCAVEAVVDTLPFRGVPHRGSHRVSILVFLVHEVGHQVLRHLAVGSLGGVDRIAAPEIRELLGFTVTYASGSWAQPDHLVGAKERKFKIRLMYSESRM